MSRHRPRPAGRVVVWTASLIAAAIASLVLEGAAQRATNPDPNVWHWGRVVADDVERTATLTITNSCSVAVDAAVRTPSPMITLPAAIGVPAQSTATVTGRLRVPRPSCRLINPTTPAATSGSALGSVRVTFTAAGGGCQLPPQDIRIQADLVVPGCWRQEMLAERLLDVDLCSAWWLSATPPDGGAVVERLCVDALRELALGYRAHVLAPRESAHPAEWSWLPSARAIAAMESPALLAFQQRAVDQLIKTAPPLGRR